MSKVIVISGAGSGFGALTARSLADAGNIVYAGIRDTAGRNEPRVAAAKVHAKEHGVDLRTVELDVSSQESVDAGIAQVLAETGRLDVIVHNAGHMVNGPTEAFLPEQIAEVFDTNVLSTQRLNRAALPHLRRQGHDLLIWVGSSSTLGGTPPYLAPYFAAKAAMDALAVSYAAELRRFGIETTIVVPGVFTSGTNHFASAGTPQDIFVVGQYEARYAGLLDGVGAKLGVLIPKEADASMVADEIARVIALPDGGRPFRTHVDPADDGSGRVADVKDRVRAEFLERLGLADLV